MASTSSSASRRPFSLPTVYEGAETGHELDYIPFAKTSKTIVKQIENLAATLSDDQWLSGCPDDATVPRLGDTDRDYCARPSPSIESTYTRKIGGASNHAKSPISTMSTSMPTSPESTVPSQHGPRIEPRLVKANNVQPNVDASPYLQQKVYRRQLPYQLRPQQQRQLFLQKQSREQHEGGTEVVFEMPLQRLGNRKPRRLRGSGSLNERYSRMMHEMELLAQGAAPVWSATADPNFRQSGNTNNPLLSNGMSNHSLGRHDLGVMGNIVCGQGISPTLGHAKYCSFQPQIHYEHELQLPGETHTFFPTRVNSVLSSSEQVQVDERFFPSAATMMHNSATGGIAYSVPYFRMSPGSSTYGISLRSSEVDPIYNVPYSSPTRQVPEGEFDGNPDFESVLLEQGPFLEDRGLCSPRDIVAASEDCTSECLKQPLAEMPCSRSERDLVIGGQFLSESQDMDPEGALNDCPVDMRERIRNIGSTMRPSAASSLPRFGSPVSSFIDFRRNHGTDKEWERSKLSQRSRFNFYPRSPPSFRLQTVGGDNSKPERREALSPCVENTVPVHIKQGQSNKDGDYASVINDHSLTMVHARQKVTGAESGEATRVKVTSDKAASTSVALADNHGGCGASITLTEDSPATQAAVIAPETHEASTRSLLRESHAACDKVALLSTRCARTDGHDYPYSPATGTAYIQRMDSDLERIAGLEREVEELL